MVHSFDDAHAAQLALLDISLYQLNNCSSLRLNNYLHSASFYVTPAFKLEFAWIVLTLMKFAISISPEQSTIDLACSVSPRRLIEIEVILPSQGMGLGRKFASVNGVGGASERCIAGTRKAGWSGLHLAGN